MQVALGYGRAVRRSCYPANLARPAEPRPRFFAAAAGRLAAEPASILFIDNSARNVEGARAAGVARTPAAQWELGQGHDVLSALARHSVIVGPRMLSG